MNNYIIYTDGSLKGNYSTKDIKPLKGGWSAIICDKNNNILKEIYGGFLDTTSPRMEIRGVLEGLKSIIEPSNIKIISDSQYVVSTIKDGWLIKILQDKQNYSNLDLWKEVYKLLNYHNVEMIWTKGHADNELNNRADKLAQFAAKLLNLPRDEYINNSKESGESLVSQFKARGSNGLNSGFENGENLYSLR